jgi:O-antigen ligase
VFPFVTAPVVTELSGKFLYLIPSSDRTYVSMFAGAKQYSLFYFILVGVLIFIGERIFRDYPPKIPLKTLSRFYIITIAVFMAFAIISCVLSDHKDVVLWGFPTDSEGLIAYFCYIILFCISYNYANLIKKREILSKALLVLGGTIVILSLFEHFITPPATLLYGIADDRTGVSLFLGSSTLFGTLCILIFPIVSIYSLGNIKLAPIAGGLIFCVIVSASSTAFYVMLIEIVLIMLIALSKKVSFKRLLVYSGITVGVVVIIALISGNVFMSYFNSVIRNTGTYSTDEKDIFLLTNIEMDGEKIVFRAGDILFTAHNNLGEYIFYNSKGDIITPSFYNNIFTFEEEEFSAIYVTYLDTVLVFDFGYTDTIEFDSVYDVFAYIGINGYLYFEITESGISPQLQNFYSFATGRGYIWLNTLPVAKECFLIGKGAGNFSFYFPQNNVVESLNVNGTSALLNDKPHNLYLQLMISFGLPALIAFLLLVVVIIGKSGKKFLFGDGVSIELGYIIGVIAFMISSLVNDSSVAVSPLLWIYLGYLTSIGSDKYVAIKG